MIDNDWRVNMSYLNPYLRSFGISKTFDTEEDAFEFIWGDICDQMKSYFYSDEAEYDEYYYYYGYPYFDGVMHHSEADDDRYVYWDKVRTFAKDKDRYTDAINNLVREAYREEYKSCVIIQEYESNKSKGKKRAGKKASTSEEESKQSVAEQVIMVSGQTIIGLLRDNINHFNNRYDVTVPVNEKFSDSGKCSFVVSYNDITEKSDGSFTVYYGDSRECTIVKNGRRECEDIELSLIKRNLKTEKEITGLSRDNLTYFAGKGRQRWCKVSMIVSKKFSDTGECSFITTSNNVVEKDDGSFAIKYNPSLCCLCTVVSDGKQIQKHMYLSSLDNNRLRSSKQDVSDVDNDIVTDRNPRRGRPSVSREITGLSRDDFDYFIGKDGREWFSVFVPVSKKISDTGVCNFIIAPDDLIEKADGSFSIKYRPRQSCTCTVTKNGERQRKRMFMSEFVPDNNNKKGSSSSRRRKSSIREDASVDIKSSNDIQDGLSY